MPTDAENLYALAEQLDREADKMLEDLELYTGDIYREVEDMRAEATVLRLEASEKDVSDL